MEFKRQIRYYYLKFRRLKGDPHDLSLGIALGVFAGMMPILPFQTALAVTLAVFLKASKITAALGTWVSNPLNWYFLYYFSYKLGSVVLNLPERNVVFSSIMQGIRAGEEPTVVAFKILGAGSTIISAFLLGGIVMGLVAAPAAYIIFLPVFRSFRSWRQSRKEKRNWPLEER